MFPGKTLPLLHIKSSRKSAYARAELMAALLLQREHIGLSGQLQETFNND